MAEPATARPAEDDSRSVGDLVSAAVQDLTKLVKFQVDLAKVELTADARRLGISGALLASAVLLLVLAGIQDLVFHAGRAQPFAQDLGLAHRARADQHRPALRPQP